MTKSTLMNIKKKVILVFVIEMIVLFVFSTAVEGIDSSYLENEIERIRADASIPSLQASIIYDNGNIWTQQFGNESQNATYMIGSVQKIFTAIAILQLYESGEITSLDDDINNYLPFEVKNPLDESTPVTFKMLLSHTSGLIDALPYQFLLDTDGIGREYGRPYNEEILAMTAKEYLFVTLDEDGAYYTTESWEDTPGSSYIYSPSGYMLLMYLIEQISGSNISYYMENNIFAPLQMDRTGFAPGINQATPHTYYNDKIKALPIWTGKYMIRSTSQDMARLLITISNKGRYNGSQLLSPESIQLMRESNQDYSYKSSLLKKSEDFTLHPNGYGLGWIRYCSGIEGHGGSVPGFQAYFLLKETDTGTKGIIIMMNLNAILGSKKDDAKHISSSFAKVRNLLLIENGMIQNNPFNNFLATYKIPLAIITAIIIPIILNRKIIKKKLGKGELS